MAFISQMRASNLLARRDSYLSGQNLSAGQVLVDHLSQTLAHEALNFSNLFAMGGGSLAYRLTQSSLSALGVFRGFSSLIALSSEVIAFRSVTNGFVRLRGETPREGVFHGQGYLDTFLSFGLLKGTGVFCGNNPFILKQSAQALAMVGGEYVGESLNIREGSRRSFTERYTNALATSLAMEAGAQLLPITNGGRLNALQRNIERSSPSKAAYSLKAASPLVLERFAAQRNESSTDHIVQAININDGCPFKQGRSPMTDRPLASLSPAEAKGEYYELLLDFLPDIVGITRQWRRHYPLGLVEYASDGSRELVSAERGFQARVAAAATARGFEGASYELHDSVARSIDLATEAWLRGMDRSDPRFLRLTELTCPLRKERFGGEAAQKRISSAMIQTVHISASFQRFISRIFIRKYGRLPSPEEMARIYDRSSATAVRLTEFHLLRTRPIREVLGSEVFGNGIVHLYTKDGRFDIVDERLELVGDALIGEMAAMPVDTSDGRIGCPGKKHIPDIWQWLASISERHAFPLLEPGPFTRSDKPHRGIKNLL